MSNLGVPPCRGLPLVSSSIAFRPLPPPIIAESQWGEPHSEAIGTGALEKRKAGQGWSGKSVIRRILAVEGHCNCTMRLESMERRSYPPPLLSPSDDLRPLPPPVIAESQWGEPRSEAIGTGARVAGSAVNPNLTPAGGQVGEEESRAGREWQTCRSSNPGRGGTLWLHIESLSTSLTLDNTHGSIQGTQGIQKDV
ncbi:hypothetical protein EI94DRAFT_1705060 [Lactarius quietus]|nr:hypothetical protein EI94DRAFT_1705060 [Lactarius quietus]